MANRSRNVMNDSRRWSGGGRDYNGGGFQTQNTDFGTSNRYRSDFNTRLSYDSSDRRRVLDDDFSYNRTRQDSSSDDMLGGRRSLLGSDSLYRDSLSIQDQLTLRENQLAAASNLLKRQSDLIAEVGMMGMSNIGLGSDIATTGGLRGRNRDRNILGKRQTTNLGFNSKRRRPQSRSPVRGNRDRQRRGRPQREAGARRVGGRSQVEHPPRQGRITKCYNCGNQGHLTDQCRKPNKDTRKCFTCGETGHKFNNCPSKHEKESKREPVYICQACDVKCENESSYEEHKKDKKHLDRMEEVEKMEDEEKNKILEKIKKQEARIVEEKKWEEEKGKRHESRHRKEAIKEPKKEYTLSSHELRKIYEQIPSHDKDTPVGVDYVAAVAGFFCKLCNKFYKKETSAKVDHCCSVAHYHLWKKAKVQILKDNARKKSLEEAATKETKEKEKDAKEGEKSDDTELLNDENPETEEMMDISSKTEDELLEGNDAGENQIQLDEENHQGEENKEGENQEENQVEGENHQEEVNGVDQTSFDQQLESLDDEFTVKTEVSEDVIMESGENECEDDPEKNTAQTDGNDFEIQKTETEDGDVPGEDDQSVEKDDDDDGVVDEADATLSVGSRTRRGRSRNDK